VRSEAGPSAMLTTGFLPVTVTSPD